jgi:hypothetical protein
MSSFMYKLLSIDIHVMCAVRHTIIRVVLLDINIYIVVIANIAVMCAVRHSIERLTL